MKIYNKGGVEIIDLKVTDSSYRYREIMSSAELTLYFSLNSYVEIPVDSYADFQGERYTLLKPQNFKKNSSRDFEYTIILESAKSLLSRYKLKDIPSKRLKFPLTAKAQEHLQMLVDNLNLRDSGWTVGDCVDSSEKVISYNHTYCDDALRMIAEAFNTEYEIVGKRISIKKVEYNKSNPLALSYGLGNGFKTGVKRENYSNSKAIEVLFVQGGERNIDFSKYGSKELLLPVDQRLKFDGTYFEGEAGFNAASSREYISDGYSITRYNKPLDSHIEDSLDCSHIYPSRVGTISSVVVVDASKNFYDFTDTSIPENLNFEDCLIAGEKMTVVFQSNMLAGKEFDVAYNHAARRFEIVPQEIDGVTMPSAIWSPAIGDKYAVFGISLPSVYVCDNATKTGASWDMFRDGVKYFYENEDPRFSFAGELDEIWAKTNWVNIGGKIILGGFISFTDEQFQNDPVLIRIVGIKDFINNPYSPQIELSNVTAGGTTSSLIKDIPLTEVVIDTAKKEVIRYAKRGFRDAQQTTKMLQSAMLNFSSSISPLTVQTMQLIAGDESLQFEFVANSGSTVAVAHAETFNPATKQFSSAAGIIQHKTLGITSISSSHSAAEYKWWSMAAYTSAVLDDTDKSYYLYAKVSKTANTGVFLLSETPIAIESVAGYYHLLVGILNSEFEGDRAYSQMYGYSELTPGRLTTKKIVSPDGQTFFDLENGVIQGSLKFQSGVRVEDDATTKANSAQNNAITAAAADATAKANAAYANSQAFANAIKTDLQSQIDGNITSWFFDYEPTLSNEPASNWTQEGVREIHLGDLFYWTSKGWSYRFQKVGTVYSWTRIADTDVTKALADAAAAQDTADSKRRVFTAQPTTPYDVGDLWTQGASGEILTCNVPREIGVFVAADWGKAAKWTDDTAVNNLQIGGRNLVLNSATRLETNDYFIGEIELSENIAIGTELTLTAWGELAAGHKLYVGLSPSTAQIALLEKNGDKYSGTFVFDKYGDLPNDVNDRLVLYNYPYGGNYIGHIEKIKVEKGNKGTDHTLAPEDVAADAQAKANAAQAAAAADATAKVAAVKIGGENLVAGSILGNVTSKWLYVEAAKGLKDGDTITVQIWGTGQVYLECYKDNGYGQGAYITANGYGYATYDVKPFTNSQYNNGNILFIATGNNVKIKIERGNKPTDFSVSQEDIDAKIAEAEYLKTAMQGSTKVLGGLVATNVLTMEDTAGTIRGGMSGLANDNVGLWTGGTYAEAIAATAKNILFKNGSFRLAGGDVVYDINQLALTISALIRTSATGARVEISKESNSIIIYDANNVARMKFAPKNVMAFSDIGGATATTTLTYTAHSNNVTGSGTATIGSTELLILDTTKYYDITTPVVDYDLYALGYYNGTTKERETGSASVEVRLVDTLKNTIAWTRMESVSSGTATQSVKTGSIQSVLIPALPGSTYRIDVYLHCDTELGNFADASAFASIEAGQTLAGTTMVNFSEMGYDGFNFINDSTHYLHYGPDIFAYKGALNFPGVLASGSVSSGAAHTNRWGHKVATGAQNITKGGTGIYNVPHNLGSDAFTVLPVATTDNINCRVTAKSYNSFQVTCRNMSGTLTDASFDYQMVGSN